MKERQTNLPVPLQFALGAALALVTCGAFFVLTVLGVPVGTAGWIVTFFVIWSATYIAMRLRLFSMLVSFMVVEFSLYFFLAARGFRL